VDLSVALIWFILAAGAAYVAATAVVLMRAHRAEQRAEELVRTMLSPAELDQLNQTRYLDVPSRTHAGRLYRIPAYDGLMAVMQDGTMVMRVCIRPAQTLPGREHVLAHKLLLEADESDYLRRANVVWNKLPR
jgi:hypothetical protein